MPFIRHMEGKSPGALIEWKYREGYRAFIEKALPKMEASVDPRRYEIRNPETGKWEPAVPFGSSQTGGPRLPSTGSGGNAGGMGNWQNNPPTGILGNRSELRPGEKPPEVRLVGKIDWPNPEIYRVNGYWDPAQPPNSREIWLIQEDLWVYRALLSVISKVNVNATGIHNATVKRIHGLLIGPDASAILDGMMARKISSGDAERDGTGSDSYSSSSDPMGLGYGEGGDELTGVNPEEMRIAKIRQFRYVDAEGKPLKHDDPAPYEQFNRMPVCLQLVVDQTKIPDILIECANCSRACWRVSSRATSTASIASVRVWNSSIGRRTGNESSTTRRSTNCG